MKKIIYETIKSEGFFFSTFKKDNTLLNHLLEVEKPNIKTKKLVLDLLHKFDLTNSNIDLVFEDFEKGDSIALHSHLVPADMQILIWAHDQEFKGREFIYGSNSKLKKFKPHFGDICFMKTNDLQFIHGVERLKTQYRVRTLLISYNVSSKLGEHLTIDSKSLNSI